MRPELIVRPACAACAGEIPNCAGDTASPAWISAEIACATIGIAAPASSAAPSRAGRHSAAATAASTSAAITATFPAMTGAGLAKAFPAVRVCTTPAGVRSV